MNLIRDRIKVSKVLQVIQEDLNVIEKTDVLERDIPKYKLVELREAFYTVYNKYNELFDLDYKPVDMSINEFIYEIENADYLSNDHDNEQVIEALKNELLDYYIESNRTTVE